MQLFIIPPHGGLKPCCDTIEILSHKINHREESMFAGKTLRAVCHYSGEYTLLKCHKRSKDSKCKPYINPLLLQDSIKSPLIESSLESKKVA